jgi:hypothetical protein
MAIALTQTIGGEPNISNVQEKIDRIAGRLGISVTDQPDKAKALVAQILPLGEP